MLDMGDPASIESRIAVLERDVANLKQRMEPAASESDWLTNVMGSMQTYPEFAQVLELGRALRASDAPNPRD
jgi:hypothetical protein